MATSSVGSTVLDVPTLVSQLMSVERRPIDQLNTKVSSYQAKISSFGTLSSLISNFKTAAQSLNSSSSSTLQAFKATPSDASILSATASSTAVAGTYSLNVTALAQSQNLVAAGTASSTTAISNGVATTVTFDFGTTSGTTFTTNGGGTKSITIDSTNNTLQGIRDAINAGNMGVTATIINDGSATPNRLTITSNATGASNSLKITTTGGDGTINSLLGYDPAGVKNLSQTVAAQNASFTANGIAITSASNSITNAIQGVALTLSKTTTSPVTLTVARDTDAINKAASGFVDAYNALYSQLKSRSAFSAQGSAGGALAGDGTLRLMQDQLRTIFNTPASGGTMTSLSQIGISSQTDGTLKLDSSKLNSALTNSYSDVVNLLSGTTGFATSLEAWSTSVLSPGVGLLATRTTSLQTSINGYNDQISKLEVRMTALQKQYTTTYSNLNIMLGSMNSTSAYLSKQLG